MLHIHRLGHALTAIQWQIRLVRGTARASADTARARVDMLSDPVALLGLKETGRSSVDIAHFNTGKRELLYLMSPSDFIDTSTVNKFGMCTETPSVKYLLK